ncbi:MAG: protein DpdH [Enhygromyxa sp.]
MKALDMLWPAEVQVRETLGIDAHTLDEAVFLAVHQRMTFRRIDYGRTASAESPVVDERMVLEALLADDGEGRVIVPIAGPSGAGKSHVIKWLEAELRARDDADCRHVILVPKSSSLKSVLRRILSDFEGPRYDEVRGLLERASDSLPEVAAKDLRTRIVAVLQSDAVAAGERIRNKSSTDRRADEMQQWGRELAALLEDPELWDRHFYGSEPEPDGVVARLAANVTREGAANRRYQFEAQDFDNLVANIDPSELSASARRPLRRLADAKYRAAAAEVFNGVLDRATQNLLDLGGTPLSEVFLELRRALLEDGKELVILVEDFAVLSGMQGALLDALIHEARVGGRREYCTIRSALAYTHGYQPMDRDTVRTRAGAEWLIEEAPGSEKEMLARAVDLVGAYLNAARWGVQALRTQRDQGTSDGNWLKSFEATAETDEEATMIEAFGRSGANHPLFPFNASAIRQLTREKCRVNDKVVFNPRLLIDRLVLDVLKLRKQYEARAFPPESLGISKVTAPEVTKAIQAQAPGSDKKLLLTLITYWAELPDSAGAAAGLVPAVYEAFGFAPIDFGAPALQPKVAPVNTQQPGVGRRTLESLPTDPFATEWGGTLDDWMRGETLTSTPARNLRTYITEALVASLPTDWPGSRPGFKLSKGNIANRNVYLPNSRSGAGLNDDDIAIKLCTTEEWNDPLQAGPIRERLEAVIRFHGMKATRGTWDWEGGEIAAVRYAEFVAERRGQLIAWLAARRRLSGALPEFSVANLIENRLLAAAVLGVGVRGGNSLESAVHVLFSTLEQPKTDPSDPDKWRRLLTEAATMADEARTALLEEVAVYQGTGKKVLAVDVAQLERPVRQFMKTWTVSSGPRAQEIFGGTVRRGVQERRKQLQEWRDSTLGWLGETFDKQEFITQVKELLTQVGRHHLVHSDKIKELRRLLDKFRDTRVAEALNETQRALREPQDGITLASLAYDVTTVSHVTTPLGRQLVLMLDEIEKAVGAVIDSSGIREVEAVATQVRAELEALSKTVADYEKVQAP